MSSEGAMIRGIPSSTLTSPWIPCASTLVRLFNIERHTEILKNDELHAQLAEKDKQHLEQEKKIKEMEEKFEAHDKKQKSQENRIRAKNKEIRELTQKLECNDFELDADHDLIEKMCAEKRELHAYENAKMFKEKIKILHDKRIQKREFKQGDQVLLFNSHFKFSTRKLISRWSKPYKIQEVYRSGALRLKGDIKGKPHIVNGQHLKHYFAGQNFVGNVEEVSYTLPEE
jgi:hypothetical protein